MTAEFDELSMKQEEARVQWVHEREDLLRARQKQERAFAADGPQLIAAHVPAR